jgi:scyllo-inositol 2-dehydrogenase (NADP+)
MLVEPTAPVRVGLIGYGLGGEVFHAPVVEANPEMRLVTIVTSDSERQARARARYPSTRVVDRVELLWERADVHDLVIVCTPNSGHVPLATAALEAGRSVVVDKPLAATAADGRALADLATGRGLLLTVFQNRRWDGDFLALRKLVEEDALGPIVRFESRYERWRPEPKAGAWRERGAPDEAGGLLFDLGSHLVDQALQLFGRPTQVYAEVDKRRPGVEVDDDVFVALTHPGGVHSHLWATVTAAILGPRFRVLGLRGAFEKYGIDPQEEALAAGARPGEPGWGTEPEELWGQLSNGDTERRVRTEPGDYPAFYRGVVEALRTGGDPPVDVRESIEGLEVLEAARESSRTGVVVALPGSPA